MFKKLAIFAVTLCTIAACAAYAGEPTTRFDVAEDHTRFVFSATPVHENGMPAHGNQFVTQGYIYPAGTLEGNRTGVNADGSPKYPDLVLGTWTCDGAFVGDGGNATSGTWLISRQVYEFNNGDYFVSQGPELADVGKNYARPITGGTGDYARTDGPIMQTLLGFSEHMGVNVSFEIAPDQSHVSAM